MQQRRTAEEPAPPTRTYRPLRQIVVYLCITYGLTLAIALALPHAKFRTDQAVQGQDRANELMPLRGQTRQRRHSTCRWAINASSAQTRTMSRCRGRYLALGRVAEPQPHHR